MDLGNLDHHSDISEAPTFKLSIALYACAWLFFWFQTLPLDAIWTWTWRGLSLISLLLIIYINWNKARDIFRGKKPIDKE